MLRSCQYCGRVHERAFDCGKKPVQRKQNNDKDKFRWSRAWQRKRGAIKQRDLYLCQVCIRKLYDTRNQYTYNDLEVHHAVSLEDDFDRRLDDDNLITLCGHHHEMAECGEIPSDIISDIIGEQNMAADGF